MLVRPSTTNLCVVTLLLASAAAARALAAADAAAAAAAQPTRRDLHQEPVASQQQLDGTTTTSFRTTGIDSVYDAGSLGGVQYFSLPISQGTCAPSSLHGFARCLLLPDGSQSFRFIAAWGRVRLERLANVAEDLSAFGAYQCDPPEFYLEPAGSSGNASDNTPCLIHDRGGFGFYPLALTAVVPGPRAAPAYALRVVGSEYFAVIDAVGGCVPPADPRSMDGWEATPRASGGDEDIRATEGEESSGGAVAGEYDDDEQLDAAAAAEGGETIAPLNMRALGHAAAAAAARQLLQESSANATAPAPAAAPAAAEQQHHLAPARLPATNWVLVSVPPTWNDNLTTYVLRLRVHVVWHQSLGFTGHIVYLDPAQISRLMLDPSFRQLLASYRIVLVRWAHFPRVSWLPWDAQGLRLSHGFLAFWGHDAGLMPIDLDEFLLLEDSPHHPIGAIPQSAALSQLVLHCGGGASAVTFERYALYCGAEHCPDGDESALWQPPPTEASASSAARTARSALSSSSSSSKTHQSGSVSPPGSPLAAYTQIEAAPHVGPKAWATAACAFPSSVHEHRLSGLPGCAQVAARPGCGLLLHLINAFHHRSRGGLGEGGNGVELLPFQRAWWGASSSG